MSDVDYDNVFNDLVTIVIVILAIVLLREIVLWFFKCRETQHILQSNRDKLDGIESVLKALIA